jgi:hypothetical protein
LKQTVVVWFEHGLSDDEQEKLRQLLSKEESGRRLGAGTFQLDSAMSTFEFED